MSRCWSGLFHCRLWLFLGKDQRIEFFVIVGWFSRPHVEVELLHTQHSKAVGSPSQSWPPRKTAMSNRQEKWERPALPSPTSVKHSIRTPQHKSDIYIYIFFFREHILHLVGFQTYFFRFGVFILFASHKYEQNRLGSCCAWDFWSARINTGARNASALGSNTFLAMSLWENQVLGRLTNWKTMQKARSGGFPKHVSTGFGNVFQLFWIVSFAHCLFGTLL